jgi:hypothetical protein
MTDETPIDAIYTPRTPEINNDEWYAPSGTFYENGEVKNISEIPNVDLMGTPYWSWENIELGKRKLIFIKNPEETQYTWRAPSGTLYRAEQIMWYIDVPNEDQLDTEWQWDDYAPNPNQIQLKHILPGMSKSFEPPNPSSTAPESDTDPETDTDITDIELELKIQEINTPPGLRF